jgi:hypothetical protein
VSRSLGRGGDEISGDLEVLRDLESTEHGTDRETDFVGAAQRVTARRVRASMPSKSRGHRLPLRSSLAASYRTHPSRLRIHRGQ